MYLPVPVRPRHFGDRPVIGVADYWIRYSVLFRLLICFLKTDSQYINSEIWYFGSNAAASICSHSDWLDVMSNSQSTLKDEC